MRSDLRQLGRWGTVRRFLDIGTCTGRYPLALRDAVREDGSILDHLHARDRGARCGWSEETLRL